LEKEMRKGRERRERKGEGGLKRRVSAST